MPWSCSLSSGETTPARTLCRFVGGTGCVSSWKGFSLAGWFPAVMTTGKRVRGMAVIDRAVTDCITGEGTMRRTNRELPGRLFRTGLALLTVATIGVAQAQPASSACKLLQVAELEAAIGGKASKEPSGSVQAVPGMTVDECSLVLSDGSQKHPVSIVIVSDIGMDGAQAIKIRNAGQAREAQWKTAGARLEQATVGNALCTLSGRPNVASHTVCSIPRGQGYVEVSVVGSVEDLPSMATVGALVEKAVSRL